MEEKLLLAGADAAEAFDASEEVLDAVTEVVEAPVPTGWVLAVLQVGDAGAAPGVPDPVEGVFEPLPERFWDLISQAFSIGTSSTTTRCIACTMPFHF